MALRKRLRAIEDMLFPRNTKGNDQEASGILKEEQFDLISRDHMYRKLIESMSEGALVVNTHRTVVYSNSRFAALTGYPLHKVIGADVTDFLVGADREKLSDCLQAAKVHRSFCEIKLGTDASGGLPVLVSIVSFLVEDELYFCLLIIDFSEQKKITEELENEVETRTMKLAVANKKLAEMNHSLKQANESLDNVIHTIVHDLRAPVANLKLIEKMFQTATPDDFDELRSAISGNIERLDATIGGLVGIINHIQGTEQASKSDLDVPRILHEVIKEQHETIEAKNAKVAVIEKTSKRINYVEGYIRSIASNMLSNALKYSVSGRPPRLEITFDEKDGHFLLVFSDNGLGIDLEKHRTQLFKPFKRFSSKADGIGIGLHIVRNMVQRNGGHIDVESTPGKGTRFIVYLREYAP